MNVSDRLKTGIRTRLSFVVPYLEKWPQAMYLGIDPKNLSNTVKQINKISDEIWFIAGDKAVDVSNFWFQNNALVLLVYKEGITFRALCVNRAVLDRGSL